MRANHVDSDEEKFVKLMHLGGRKIQELYETQPIPKSIAERPRGPFIGGYRLPPNEYEISLAKLNEFFLAKKNATYERHQFRLIKQENDEKIGKFAMRLRAQAERCSFGDKADEHIKDQLIEKCLSPKLRVDMLRCGDDNLEKILNVAMNFEAIEEQRKAYETNNAGSITPEVNKIDNNRNDAQKKTPPPTTTFNERQLECTRCGFTGHRSFEDKCPAKGKTCNKCGGKDHFMRKCRAKKRPNNWNTNKKPTAQSTDEVKTEEELDEKRKKPGDTVKYVETKRDDEYIFCIGDQHNEIQCAIGGVPIKVIIDSGTRFNIVDSGSWEMLKNGKAKVSNQRKKTEKTFKAYGGHELTVIGVFEAILDITGKTTTTDFYVVKDFGKVLIGYETAIPMGILKIGADINAIDGKEPLSKIKGVMVDIPIKNEIRTVIQPYRRIPIALEEAAMKKIDELLVQDIIEEVKGPSKWVSQLVITPKANDIRVCVDMRRANEAIKRENYPLPTMEDFLPQIGNSSFFTKLDIQNAFHQVIH